MLQAKIDKLNKMIRHDNRFYFVKNMNTDYSFHNIGQEVNALVASHDDEFPSGVSIKVKMKNSGEILFLDSDVLIDRVTWVGLFNTVTQKAASRAIMRVTE